MAESAAFKELFSGSFVRELGEQIRRGAPGFDAGAFAENATQGLSELEFSGRVQRIADALARALAESHGGTLDFGRACHELERGLPEPLRTTKSMEVGRLQWPVGDWIARHGFDAAGDPLDTGAAFQLMTALTQRFTSEFAVRPYVAHDPGDSVRRLSSLTAHPNPHVRRWCSEGLRPRLPWGARLNALVEDPAPLVPVLDALVDDPEEYVRRSVANTLGDVAKDHPGLACEVASRWAHGGDAERLRTVRHALRAPIKAGEPRALAVLGFGPPDGVRARVTVAPGAVRIGGSVEVRAELVADRPLRALVDLRVEYVKANGRRSPKVFKWKEVELTPGARLELARNLDLVPRTTRRLHPGRHAANVQVNGVVLGGAEFDLE
ncbi:MAG: DNA alkylation repair protein [Planctomycetota bacterium]